MNDRYRTDLFVQHLYKDQPGKLRFDPEKIRTKEEFDAWKEQVREKAYELMQFPEDAYEKPEVRFLFSRQRDGYRVEKYEISPEPELWIPFLLLVPDTVSTKNKAPGVLCFPGWDVPKEMLCGEESMNLGYGEPVSEISYPFSNAMALRYVRKGMVALACDNMGTCEQEGLYDRQQFALKMIFKGRNYVGLSVFCRWAMFNWLAEQDYVDENRMGLAAHSLGTETSMFLALLEPRVKAVSHNDFMSDNEQRIISTSEIRCVGNTILVNVTRLAPPYHIKVIGNPAALQNAIQSSTTYEKLRVGGFPLNYTLTSTYSNNLIQIPAYVGNYSTNYITLAE